jgi:hypothetical protein
VRGSNKEGNNKSQASKQLKKEGGKDSQSRGKGGSRGEKSRTKNVSGSLEGEEKTRTFSKGRQTEAVGRLRSERRDRRRPFWGTQKTVSNGIRVLKTRDSGMLKHGMSVKEVEMEMVKKSRRLVMEATQLYY